MSEKYKYEFLKYLFAKLDLKQIESKIIDQGIVPLDEKISGLYSNLSKYFSLVNFVDENSLSSDLKEKYYFYLSLTDDEIMNKGLQADLHKFIEDSYKVLLFPKIKENFCFYGPLNYKYIAPRDAVVLGFNYCEFSEGVDAFDSKYTEDEEFICDILNYIQSVLGPKIGINIAVLRYNEFTSKKGEIKK